MVAVISALERRGKDPLLVDAQRLDEADYLLEPRDLELGHGGEVARAELSAATKGWIRRLAPPFWRTAIVSGGREAAIRNAYVSLAVALATHHQIDWLTPFDRLLLADNKIFQARVAEDLGLPVPANVVCSRPADVPAELGARVVVKPLGTSHFTDDDKVERVVFARAVDRQELEQVPLGGAPFLVQSLIEASIHLRVVTVGDRCWTASLDARGLPLDWRSDDRAHDSFITDGNELVEVPALRLAAALGLGFTSQDWALDRNGGHLLDVNPGGQWLFLPSPIADAVTEEIARWLARTPDVH